MKTRIEIDTQTDHFAVFREDENGNLQQLSEESLEELNQSEVNGALHGSLLFLRDLVSADLRDIWRRIDRLEEKE